MAAGSTRRRGRWTTRLITYHMKTLLKRAAVTGVPMGSLATLLFLFATTMQLERVHPLQGGILRMKHLSELRPGLNAHPLGFSGCASCLAPRRNTRA